ncbi:hypothetical protein ACOSQ2_008600 [Xanthoceras sorbifolium]
MRDSDCKISNENVVGIEILYVAFFLFVCVLWMCVGLVFVLVPFCFLREERAKVCRLVSNQRKVFCYTLYYYIRTVKTCIFNNNFVHFTIRQTGFLFHVLFFPLVWSWSSTRIDGQ